MQRLVYNIFFLVVLLIFPVTSGTAAVGKADSIPESARLLSNYVQIASVTGQEKAAGQYLSGLAAKEGLHIRILTDHEDSYNFVASLYPLEEKKPNIILLNHIDVVPAGDDLLWTFPPFSGTIADGYVWGRGAIDNKAMGIMQLMTLADFVEQARVSDFPVNVSLLAVSSEETGGKKGIQLVLENFLDELNPLTVYGEGGVGLKGVIQAKPDTPYFGIEIAQKTGLWFSVRANDPTSGHGSIPRKVYPAREIVSLSSNLLSARQPLTVTPAVRFMLGEIGGHEKGLRKVALRNIRFFRHFIGNTLRNDPITNALLTNTVTLTDMGNDQGAYNQIAHTAWVTFDCRLLPGTSAEAFLKSNKKHFGDHFDHIEIINSSPVSGTSETGLFFKAMEEAVLEVFDDVLTGPIVFPAHNDNLFFRINGIPAYGLLPCIMPLELIESIHNIDERMEIQSLQEGIAVYKALIRILLDRAAEGLLNN